MAAEQTNPVEVDEAVPPERLGPVDRRTRARRERHGRGHADRGRIVEPHVPRARRRARLGAAAPADAPRPGHRARHGPRAPHAVGAPVDRRARSPRRSSACDDESVIGAPFYMMARLDGVVYDDVDATASLTEEQGLRGVVRARRRARPPARGRLRGGGPRRLRPSRRIPRAPGEAVADPVGEVEDGRDARGRRGRAAARAQPPRRQPQHDRPRRLQLQQHDVPTRRPDAHAGGARLGDVDARRSAHRRRHGRGVLDRRRRHHVAQPQAAGAPRQRRASPTSTRCSTATRPRAVPTSRRSTSTAPSPPTSWP